MSRIIGYKGTYDYRCKNQLYEIGKEYKLEGSLKMCHHGFHYCKKAKNVLTYYPYDSKFKLLEIEDLSNETINENNKSCSNHIKIIREITNLNELLKLLGHYYTFNSMGYELTYKNTSGHWFEFTYDDRGNELTYKNHHGQVIERTYHKNGNLSTVKYYVSSSDGKQLMTQEYSYNENGNKLN